MRTIDFGPLSRSTIGYEHLLDLLDTSTEAGAQGSYPPYNIEKFGEDKYRIALAVAGFAEQDLSITAEPNLLTIEGQPPSNAKDQYLYRGIGARPFQLQFNLADFIKVRAAKLENGLLTIELERELPEEMKPRRIEIGKGGGPSIIKGKQVA